MSAYFHYRSLDELREDAQRRGLAIPLEADTGKVQAALGRQAQVGSFAVGNSLAIHPMEGCDGDANGSPDALTKRRYDRFATGGAKLIWFEATAVVEEGRANPRQLWLHEGNTGEYARLLERTRELHRQTFGNADDLLDVLQLTHSGRYSYRQPLAAYNHPILDKPNTRVLDDDYIERLEDAYVAAAQRAKACGFRAIDLKLTHGYFGVELLGARTRPGKYGGSFENRTRFARNVLGKIRAAAGKDLILAARLAVHDGIPYKIDPATKRGVPAKVEIPYKYGFGNNFDAPEEDDLTEPKAFIKMLEASGVELLNVSLGVPYYNPHVGRPFDKADEGNYETPEHPMIGVARHFRIAGELQRTFPNLPMIGTGYSWLQKYLVNAGAANLQSGDIRFVGYGRAALPYPDLARDVLERGELDERIVCKTLTFCTYLMRNRSNAIGQFPTGCPPFDKEVYGPIMKEAKAAKKAKA
jgi:2,4-dienoyl-CoA reductase-like NADH-dependent reductase (Old Yellow Enzyme family)